MTTATAHPVTSQPLAIHVGDTRQADNTVVMRRVCVRCQLKTPDREFDHDVPMEEIPLLRALYRHYGGKVTILGGVQHEVFRKYLLQNLTRTQLQNIIETYTRNYNGVMIQKRPVDIFDEIYGKGDQSTFIEKMKKIVELWEEGNCDADHLENIQALVFPHVTAENFNRQVTVKGVESLTPDAIPEPGKRASEVPQEPVMAHTPTIDVGDVSLDQEEPSAPSESISMMGDSAPDTDLIDYLADADRGDDRLEPAQAHAIAGLVLAKPPVEWEASDYEAIPGLTKRNHPRIKRLIDSFYQSTDEGEDSYDFG